MSKLVFSPPLRTASAGLLAAGACVATMLWADAASGGSAAASVTAGIITLEFDQAMRSRVVARFDGRQTALEPMQVSELLMINGRQTSDFALRSQRSIDVQSSLGHGRRLMLTGVSGQIEKTVNVDQYASFPDLLLLNVIYRNTGTSDLKVDGWANARHKLEAKAGKVRRHSGRCKMVPMSSGQTGLFR